MEVVQEDRSSSLPPFPSSGKKASWIIFVLGICVFGFGLFSGFSSQSLSPLLLNSLTVVFLSVSVALIIGGICGWILGWTKIPGKVFWVSLAIGWAICPLAVQLSAFDAMWGRRNWLALFGRVSYGRVVDGLLAVTVIHSLVAIPWVILIVAAGRKLFDIRSERAAALEMPWWKVFALVSVRKNIGIYLSAVVLVAAMVFEQFLVTDVYQVRTWAEVWYLSFSMQQGSLWDTLINLSPSQLFPETWDASLRPAANNPIESGNLLTPVLTLTIGAILITSSCVGSWIASKSDQMWQDSWLAGSKSDRWSRLGLLIVFVLIPVLFLFGSLVARAGLKAVVAGSEASMEWSTAHFLAMMKFCFADFLWPMFWSISIGIGSAGILCTAGILAGWTARRFLLGRVLLLPVAAFLLIVPSPMVSLLCYEFLFLSSIDAVSDLANVSILGPVLAIALKGFGLASVLYWILFQTVPESVLDQARMEGAGQGRVFFEFAVKNFGSFHFGFLLMATIWAAGDLACSFAVLPAGIDTVPRRILGDLHAGAGDKVAMICLIQLFLTLVIGFFASLLTRGAKIEA